MVFCFLCCRCVGSLLVTTCVLLGSVVIYINLVFIDKKKVKKLYKFQYIIRNFKNKSVLERKLKSTRCAFSLRCMVWVVRYSG